MVASGIANGDSHRSGSTSAIRPLSLITFRDITGMELEAQKRVIEISLNALRALIQGGGRTVAERIAGEFRRNASKLKGVPPNHCHYC